MKEIKPMQLWRTESGDYAFISEAYLSGNLAIGVNFGESFSQIIRSWYLDTGLCAEHYYDGSHSANLVTCLGEIKMYEDSTTEEASNKYVSLDYFLEFQEMVRNKFAEQDRGLVSLCACQGPWSWAEYKK